jgi:hypothetical protein
MIRAIGAGAVLALGLLPLSASPLEAGSAPDSTLCPFYGHYIVADRADAPVTIDGALATWQLRGLAAPD